MTRMTRKPEGNDVDETIAMAADYMAPLRTIGLGAFSPEARMRMAQHVVAMKAALHAALWMLTAWGGEGPTNDETRVLAKLAADELERRDALVKERNA